MELEQLQKLLGAHGDQEFRATRDEVIRIRQLTAQINEWKKQLDPLQHEVMERKDKIVHVPDPMAGEGSTATVPEKVVSTKLPIPLQKRIVRMAATFLCGNPVKLGATPEAGIQEKMLEVLKKSWKDCKLDFLNKKIAKIMMSETEVAELWYVEKVDPKFWDGTANQGKSYKLRMKILASKFGDTLHPVFNAQGDMVAFGREYKVQKDVGVEEEHFDLYLAQYYYMGVVENNAWVVKRFDNFTDKIPVIFHSQEVPEWYDVQRMIARLESSISSHGDTNDYNGSPITVVEGKVLGYAKKGESGKFIEVTPGAKLSQLVWNSAPESIKMEQTNLRSLIHDMSATPDISFERMATIGGNLTNFGVQMMFLDAHMKSSEHEEDFGIGIQRRINFMMAAHAVINVTLGPALVMDVSPVFEYFMPENIKEKIENLSIAAGGKPIISQETAVKLNPLVTDADTEFKKVQDEGAADAIGGAI